MVPYPKPMRSSRSTTQTTTHGALIGTRETTVTPGAARGALGSGRTPALRCSCHVMIASPAAWRTGWPEPMRAVNRRCRNSPGRAASSRAARVAPVSLVASGVAAVLNAKPSVSGRYPNLGPEVLIKAGIPLVDDLGEELFDRLREGKVVKIDADTVYLGEEAIAKGCRQDAESVAEAMSGAREGPSVQLEA